MNFTKFDMELIIIMSIAIILMSYVFPAAGLTSMDPAEENEIPEFNITSDRFDFAGDFPDRPNTPSQGTLEYIDDQSSDQDDSQIWLQRATNGDDYLLSMNNLEGNLSDPQPTIFLIQFNETGVEVDNDNTTLNEGEFAALQAGGYEVGIEVTGIENVGQSDLTFTADWEILSDPTDDAWYAGIPILGTAGDATEKVGQVLGWLGVVLWWISVTFFEIAFNLIGILFDGMVFLVDLMHWLTSTYGSIIDAADGFASVFVSIPGIALFLEFVKIVYIGIGLLPTT